MGVSCAQICLEYIRQIGFVDVVILGVNSSWQINQLLSNHNKSLKNINWSDYRVSDIGLTNPMNWANR